jgi:hypothetical protein
MPRRTCEIRLGSTPASINYQPSTIIDQPIDLAASKPAVVANALLEFTDFGFKASNRLLGLG